MNIYLTFEETMCRVQNSAFISGVPLSNERLNSPIELLFTSFASWNLLGMYITKICLIHDPVSFNYFSSENTHLPHYLWSTLYSQEYAFSPLYVTELNTLQRFSL